MDGCGSQLLQADQGHQSGLRRLPSSTEPCAATGCEGAAAPAPLISRVGSPAVDLLLALEGHGLEAALPDQAGGIQA